MTDHPEQFSPRLANMSARSPNTEAGLQGSAQSEIEVPRVAVIERRSFVRECLIKSLRESTDWTVAAYDSADAWLAVAGRLPASLVVVCLGGAADVSGDELADRLPEITALAPVALMADSEEPADIVAALEHNVRGYIPTNLPLQIAIEAMRLVRAGGVFVPASSLIASQKSLAEPSDEKPKATSMFTSRQLSVISALRKGKANKIIAYELNMRESTVKVHVRNIMKKLKARNRTEVAYLANTMLSGDQR